MQPNALRRNYYRGRGGLPMRPRPRQFSKGRLLIGFVMAIMALFSYVGSKQYNPVTGSKQYVSITPRQEIALGLQAMPKMVQQHGGLHPDPNKQQLVDTVGMRLVQRSTAQKTNWQFEFHLLADSQTVNAFALPGGQIFITNALFSRLKTEGQLAGVLGHEIGHVVARHGAQRIAKQNLTQGLIGAVVVGSDGGYQTARTAQAIGQVVNMKFGRDDELQSDSLGVQFMAQAGYDPRAMISVMKILAAAGGGQRQAEFFSTHPNPDNRIERIGQVIEKVFPNGLPTNLIP